MGCTVVQSLSACTRVHFTLLGNMDVVVNFIGNFARKWSFFGVILCRFRERVKRCFHISDVSVGSLQFGWSCFENL